MYIQNLKVIIKSKMRAQKITQEKLSELIDVTPGMVGHILTGRRNPSIPTLQKIFDVLNIKNIDLSEPGEHIKKRDFSSRKETMKIPVLLWDQTANWKQVLDNLVMDDKAHTIEVNKYEYVKDSFSLVVEGDAMVASHGLSFPYGTTIIIDPHRAPEPGQYALAELTEAKESVFKKLAKDGGKSWLMSLNDRYPSIEVNDKVKIIGTVIESRNKLV